MKIKNIDLTSSIHFLGIGGSGMYPLAALARKRGYRVSGSDSKCTELKELEDLGISIAYSHTEDNIHTVDLLVVSSAIKSDNLELVSAQEKGIPIVHRSDLLAFLAKGKIFLSIAGTHGKTTTSSILAFLLQRLELFPDAVVGGSMKYSSSSWLNGDGQYFVGEADESDGTFQTYTPNIAVVTNIDLDHLDFYRSKGRLHSAFENYINNTVKNGTIIVGIDSPDARRLFDQYPGQKASFGLSNDADLCAYDLGIHENTQTFKIKLGDRVWPAMLRSLAKHDLLNALAALSVVYSLNLNLEEAIAQLGDFPGVSRRLDPVFVSNALKVIDDYAHNPGKIKASIRACQRAWPKHKIKVVFEPHRYSRIDSVYTEFCSAFAEASEVFVTNIYRAGEQTIEKYTPKKIAKDIGDKSSTRANIYRGPSQLLSSEKATKMEKTVILFVGAGDSQKFAFEFKRRILAENPDKFQ